MQKFFLFYFILNFAFLIFNCSLLRYEYLDVTMLNNKLLANCQTQNEIFIII